MHILKVGFNYKSAPIEIREKFAFPEEKLAAAMLSLKKQKSILENVIISTCNRTEIYAVVDQLHTGRYYIKQFIENWFQIDKDEFVQYLQIEDSDAAIKHLFHLACGLDSMVLGETQILGQVRDSFLIGQNKQTTGTIFNELFKQVVTFAKRVHNETGIGEKAVSVSYAAVELAKKVYGDLSTKHVVIVGAGEMGALTAENLTGAGVENITVINRTLENAKQLAEKINARAADLEQLNMVLPNADIIISSTGSSSLILNKEDILTVQKQRKGSPLFLVDIAVPRDLDPRIGELENVFLYDIDDLQHIVDENLASRKRAAEKISVLIVEEMKKFAEWLNTLGVVPVITALRKKALAIQAETMKSIERKIPDLTEREKKVLSKHTKSIINQLLKDPITQAKELAGSDDADKALTLFVDIFGIEEEVQEELAAQAKKNSAIPDYKKNEKLSFGLIKKVITN